jgi:predicted metal-binding protein
MPESLREQFEEALKGRAWQRGVIDTKSLIFSEAVRKACEYNSCGNYNRCWTCPPGIGSLEETGKKILAWKKAFVFTTKFDLEDSFDFEGMGKAKELHDELTREIQEKFGKEYPIYGAGGCKYCSRESGADCAYPEPCRFPEKALYSIEAMGINVMDLSKAAGVNYINGQNTVTFFSMILFDDKA